MVGRYFILGVEVISLPFDILNIPSLPHPFKNVNVQLVVFAPNKTESCYAIVFCLRLYGENSLVGNNDRCHSMIKLILLIGEQTDMFNKNNTMALKLQINLGSNFFYFFFYRKAFTTWVCFLRLHSHITIIILRLFSSPLYLHIGLDNITSERYHFE